MADREPVAVTRRRVAGDAADGRRDDKYLAVVDIHSQVATGHRFQQRPTFIARRVSWAPDGQSIFAAVGEGDADIVVFEAGDSSIRRGPAVAERRDRERLPSMSLLSLQRLTVRLRK